VKKAKLQFWKKQNAIMASFLALLGFASSCKNDSQVKYGIPAADFIVKGKVESALNNTPINNIRIILNQDSLVTDVNGNYQFPAISDIAGNKTYAVRFKDIDGATNVQFKTLDTIVSFTNPVYTNGDGEWYEGETEKVFNVKLKPE
jgi:putative lipoprotein (rSAM/lipoprotein system)